MISLISHHFLYNVAWVIQGCVLILHIMSVATTIFINQLAIFKTCNYVWFMMDSGALSI